MRRQILNHTIQLALAAAVLVLAGCGRVERIATDAGPGSLAVDPKGRYLYIGCEDDGNRTVLAWDLKRKARAATATVGAGPLRLYLSVDGRRLYVLCRGTRRLLVFGTPALRLEKTLILPDGPTAWSYEPERHLDLVCSPDSDQVRVFMDKNPLPAVEAGTDPADMLLQPGTDRLWVANFKGHDLAVISLEQGRVVGRVPVKKNPLRLQLAPSGDTIYVLCTGQDALPPTSVVQAVDIFYRRAGLTQTVGAGARDFALGSRGRLSGCLSPEALRVTNRLTRVEKILPTGRDPQAVVLAPDEARAYVSCRGERAVFVHRLNRQK